MKKRRFLIPALVFLLYAALAWVGAYFLAPPDVFALVVFVLIALGLTVLIVYFLMARLHAQSVPRASVEPARESERITAHPASSDHPEVAGLTALINEANNRLARSPKLANRQVKATVTRLPLFLLGGIEGSGKTSTFLKSGLEPELLAGQVFHDSNVLPTRLANFWFAEDCLFVELSGALFSGGIGLWSAILAKLQGRSAKGFLKRIFGGKTEAQLRGFVLFCNIAPFLGVPDPSQLGGLSRRIQERLRAVGESFGTNFPVYVVFTNSEGIPYFNEFFSRLLESEDQQILGCTLPALAPGARPAGEVYAESETARVSAALNNLYYSLAEKRLAVLPRETNLPARPFVYEFPREMKRIRDTLVQFLVDVFRPNPLQPGPILRGCYFTGTRQVTASALGPAGAENIARPSHGEATSLFNLAEYQQKMGLAPETPQGLAETTIQRWSFVAELFHRVILPDPIGRAVAFASSQQTMYKRIAFGAAAALGLIAGLFWIRSWWNNASLLGDIEAAAQTSDTFRPNVRAVPSHDTLKGLDGLRVQLQTLLDYDRHGAPWRMRSGLYAGEHVLPAAYGLYFQRFQQLFFEEILSSFSGTLKRLPLSPDSRNSYDDTYDRVKAYRMVTQGRCSPDPPFLVPVMASAWFAGRTLDEDSQSLVLKQLSFYANELKLQNPYPKAAEDRDAVGHGQLYLASFGGSSDRLYRSLIEEANKSPRSPARLADLAPNYKLALNSPGEVAAAYTKDGWVFVNSAIKDPSNLKLGDPCVLGNGDTAKQLLQIPELQSDLQNLYVRDYIRRWKDFTAATNVVSFGSVADASNKLDILADNRSPLLAAVFMIAENTNFPAQQKAPPIPASVINKFVPSGAKKALNIAKQTLGSSRTADMGDITRIFQPARAIVSVDNRDRWITDPNQAYMTALANLRLAMQRLKDDRSSSPDLSLNKEAENDVNFGLSKVTEVVQRFNAESADLKWLLDSVNADTPRDGVDSSLKRLLEAPFKESLRFVVTDPGKLESQRAGAALRSFCSRLSQVERKFPFNVMSDIDATKEEVSGIFAPQSGALAAFEQQLAKLIIQQGRLWVANPSAQDTRPTADFLRFINRMQQIQDALFADGSPQFKMRYALKPSPAENVDAVTLDLDGHKITAERNSAQAEQFNWPGSGQVLVTVRAGGNIPFGSYSGPWGIFRWMYDADPRAPGSKTAAWSMLRQGHGQPQQPTDAQGHPIVLRVEISDFPSGVDVFDRNFFNARCPARVTD